MKRIVLGLLVAAVVGLSVTPAVAHGPHRGYGPGPRVGFYAGYGVPYRPYPPPYYPRPVYYPAPVPAYPAYAPYPAYPVYPAYPRAGFSYFSPGFSISVAN